MKLKSRKAAALLIFFFVLIVGTVASPVVCLANDYCTIRVDYKYSDGSVAHDPYVAVLTYGDEVNLSVKNPIIPGYKPVDSLEAQAESAATTVLNYPSLDDDKTITVYYVPDLVHYRVRYFKQNVRDDLYTEDLSLSNDDYEKKGYTGSMPDSFKDFSGFTSLYHDTDTIAADGSTVFKVYYERNYYLVNFHLGEGGYGVEPVYAKQGTTYNIATPKRAGYDFLGWVKSNDNGDYLDDSGNTITETQARNTARK